MADLTPDEQAELKALESQFGLSGDEEAELAELEAKFGLSAPSSATPPQGTFYEGLFSPSGFASDLSTLAGSIGGLASNIFRETPKALLSPLIPDAVDPFLSQVARHNARYPSNPLSDIDNSPPRFDDIPAVRAYNAVTERPRETAYNVGLAASNALPIVGPVLYQEAIESLNPDLERSDYDTGVLARQGISDLLLAGAGGLAAKTGRGTIRGLTSTPLVDDQAVQRALGYAERKNLLQGKAASDITKLERGTLQDPGTADTLETLARQVSDPELLPREIAGELGAFGGENNFDRAAGVDLRSNMPKLLERNFFDDNVKTFPQLLEKTKLRKAELVDALEADLEAIEKAVPPREILTRIQTKDAAIQGAKKEIDNLARILEDTKLAEDAAKQVRETSDDLFSDFYGSGKFALYGPSGKELIEFGIPIRRAVEKVRTLNDLRRTVAKEFDAAAASRKAQGQSFVSPSGFEDSLKTIQKFQSALEDAIEQKVAQYNRDFGTNLNPRFLKEFNEEYGALRALDRSAEDFSNKTDQGRAVRAANRIVQSPGQTTPTNAFVPTSTTQAIAGSVSRLLGQEGPNSQALQYIQTRRREQSAVDNIRDLLALRDQQLPVNRFPQAPPPSLRQRIGGISPAIGAFNQDAFGASALLGPLATPVLFPRNSTELEARQQELISAIAQKPGTTPGELEDLAAIFAPNVNPRQRAIGLAQVAQNHPELFEPSEFSSLMDGIIHDTDEIKLGRDQVNDDLKLGRITPVEATTRHTAISRRTNNVNIPNSRRQEPIVLASRGLNTTAY